MHQTGPGDGRWRERQTGQAQREQGPKEQGPTEHQRVEAGVGRPRAHQRAWEHLKAKGRKDEGSLTGHQREVHPREPGDAR